MAIMVTGTGFVGSYVARDLLEQGEDVVLYGYFGGQGEPASLVLPDLGFLDELLGGNLFDKVDVVVGDITDIANIRSTMEEHQVTGVIHLAGMLGVAAEANPPLSIAVNAMGTANVFQSSVDLGVQKVAWASSVTVFGPGSVNAAGMIGDDCTADPTSVYGATKVFNESLARRYFDSHGLKAVGIRPNRIYGYGEHIKLKRGSGSGWFFEALYNTALESGPSRWLFGDKSLDFHYVDDVALAFITALRSDHGGGQAYLTGGDFRPIADAYAFLRELVPGADLSLVDTPENLPSGSSSIWATRPDISRAATDLGIRPQVSMEEGLFRTVNRYRQRAGLPALDRPNR